MAAAENNVGKFNNQKISLIEGIFYSLMVGLGETYLVAFALSLGVSDLAASYLAILPIIFASVLQFLLSSLAAHSQQKARWLMICSGGQSLVLFILAGIGFSGLHQVPASVLAIFASIYWTFGFVAGPIWNISMVSCMAPTQLNLYFYRRNALMHICSLLSLVLASLILGRLEASSPQASFLIAVLLASAGLARALSMWSFSKHAFPLVEPKGLAHQNEIKLNWLKRPYIKPALLFMFVVTFGVQISGPFFSVYMLKELNLDFVSFNILLGSAFFSRTIAGYVLNRWVQKFGVKFLLVFGTIGITPLPALWVLTDNFWLLLLVQLLAGLTWGCHELGLTLSLIELVPHHYRSRLLTWANLVNAVGMAAGISVATLVIRKWGLYKEIYHILFLFSSSVRGLAVLFALRLFGVQKARPVLFRLLGFRPSGGDIMKPILLPDEPEKPVK